MKRLILALIGALTLTLLPVVQAGAATVTAPAPASSTYQPFMPGTNVNTLVQQADQSFAAAHPDGAVHSHATIQIGWGTVLLTLNHWDVQSLNWNAFFAGIGASAAVVCALLPGWVSTIGCIFALAFFAAQFLGTMQAAVNRWSWYVPIGQCGTWGGYAVWGEQCNLPGAHAVPDFFGRLYWIAEHQVSGMNILFTWLGNPIGWQINDLSG